MVGSTAAPCTTSAVPATVEAAPSPARVVLGAVLATTVPTTTAGAHEPSSPAEEDATALLTAAQLDGVQLSLTLCDDAFIHALNREYRSVDRPTDVLSFPLDDDVLLGDVVISLDTAAAQAAQRGHELRDELRVLLVHGLLHVLGYDHELGALEHGEMAEAEQRLLRRLGWTGDGLIDAVDRG